MIVAVGVWSGLSGNRNKVCWKASLIQFWDGLYLYLNSSWFRIAFVVGF